MGDPDFTAVPRRGGGWGIERHERGSVSHGVLEHDVDLVLLWMDHFRSRFPLPFGHSYQRSDAALLAPAARAARRAHGVDASYPYLVTWRAERDAALGEN